MFTLQPPPPAVGLGACPRSAAELAARRARPASAQPRTCGGGWRLKGGAQQSHVVARERYFVPPPSREVHQEGTTLFFVPSVP